MHYSFQEKGPYGDHYRYPGTERWERVYWLYQRVMFRNSPKYWALTERLAANLHAMFDGHPWEEDIDD